MEVSKVSHSDRFSFGKEPLAEYLSNGKMHESVEGSACADELKYSAIQPEIVHFMTTLLCILAYKRHSASNSGGGSSSSRSFSTIVAAAPAVVVTYTLTITQLLSRCVVVPWLELGETCNSDW